VNAYLNAVRGTPKQPVSGYASGRAYPDISALGHNYLWMGNGSLLVTSGTSAATPVIAGMIALVNSQRLARGESTMGFINPFLYAKGSSFVIDITSGSNFCTKSASLCCTQGFQATAGW
jgi:tripeptidyl-peptidase-1